jgi:hypothetical protein
MGLFSNPECPVHGIEYKVGTDGLEDFYYCPKCREDLREKRCLEERVKHLEKMIAT